MRHLAHRQRAEFMQRHGGIVLRGRATKAACGVPLPRRIGIDCTPLASLADRIAKIIDDIATGQWPEPSDAPHRNSQFVQVPIFGGSLRQQRVRLLQRQHSRRMVVR